MSPSARKPKKAPPKQRPAETRSPDWETSQAEIRVAYTPAGRETLDAITAEVFGDDERDTGPEIQIGEEPAGRETLAAIADELRPSIRQPQDTLPYADRISNAPGARSPSRSPLQRAPADTAPDISVRHAPAGRETLAAIEAELRADPATPAPRKRSSLPPAPAAPPASAASTQAVEPLEIFEMMTFVVRGSEAARLSTDALRRRFAEEHLMRRLPISSSEDIDRVDVTPWTVRDTFVVRVWCKLRD